jgi:hypothetical protein
MIAKDTRGELVAEVEDLFARNKPRGTLDETGGC